MSLQRTLKTRLAIRPPGTGTFLLPGTSSRPPLSHFLPLRTPAGTITHCCFHCPRSWTCQGNCLSTQVPYFKLLLLNRSRPAGNYHMSYRWPGGNMSFCHFLCSLERTLEALWLLPPGGTCPYQLLLLIPLWSFDTHLCHTFPVLVLGQHVKQILCPVPYF
jgi:hypothetical protein